MRESVLFVVGCDAKFFALAQGTILSLRQASPRGEQSKIGFLDCGCTPQQQEWLRRHVDLFRLAAWDYAFPGRDQAPGHLKALLARPWLPNYFPGFEVYCWLDADCWVEDGQALALFCQGARQRGLAIVPELDRGQLSLQYGNLPRTWKIFHELYRALYGAEVAQQLHSYPMLNAGVFAMHRDAPHWQPWREQIVSTSQRSVHFVDQITLNAVVYRQCFAQTELLPAWCNWTCHAGLPGWDRRRQRLVEPYLPHQPIGIVHLTTTHKPESAELRSTEGEMVRVYLRYPARALSNQEPEAQPARAGEATVPEDNNLGVQLLAQGRFAKAEALFRRVLLLRPDLPEAAFNLAKALQGQERPAEAEPFFLQALRESPNWAEGHFHLGLLYDSQRRLSEAAASFRRALDLKPDHVQALNQYASILYKEGRIDEARPHFEKALALAPEEAFLHSNLLLNEQYDPDATLADLAELHAGWEQRHAAPLRSTWRPFPQTRDAERPLRLGFVSGDFALHPVGFFLAPVLERLDRQQWCTVCYANQERQDELTHRLKKAATLWRFVADLSDEALAEQIRDDNIDLLIDLSGHTGRNRLLTMARRPAPLQFTWMGYVGTTGLSAIDYLIADRFHVPPGCEEHYREQILRLPDGYLCYEPPVYAPPVGPLPALLAGHLTFGCFNNTAKITPAVAAVWATILRRVRGARLVLKYHWLNDAGLRQRLDEQFAAAGITAERLELLGSTSHVEQFKQYNRIDLALDPFPYSGGLTTCEACWMGVPVVTCPGGTFASRHSFSYLSNIGLTETITRTRTEYVDKAVSLAGDLDTLAGLRACLRQQMARSPVCNCDRFTGQLAAALRQVWRAWCATTRE